MIDCLLGPVLDRLQRFPPALPIGKLIDTSDESVMREYLDAQADALTIEFDPRIDGANDGNVEVMFMGPYLRGVVPKLNWFQANASQELARTWGRQFCDAMRRSQIKHGTVLPWTIIIDAWVLPLKNAKPHTGDDTAVYDEVLRCQLGPNYKVTITKKDQVESSGASLTPYSSYSRLRRGFWPLFINATIDPVRVRSGKTGRSMHLQRRRQC
jgi:hypothetical protein